MNHPDGWQGGILNRFGAFWRAISGGCDLSADGHKTISLLKQGLGKL
jgi:hypothetical protein